MSDALSKCWGSNNDLMVDSRIYSPGEPIDPGSKFIDEFGIKQYWATVIYFRKSELASMFFELIRHVQENYQYYRKLYYFSNGMFRNDYAVSIAVHTLNGFSPEQDTIQELPILGLLMAWDTIDIHSVSSINDVLLYTTPLLTRITEIDVHIMNKWAINRVADKLLELYKV
jgi:hypothetical protein